jgi:hypothetical protein
MLMHSCLSSATSKQSDLMFTCAGVVSRCRMALHLSLQGANGGAGESGSDRGKSGGEGGSVSESLDRGASSSGPAAKVCDLEGGSGRRVGGKGSSDQLLCKREQKRVADVVIDVDEDEGEKRTEKEEEEMTLAAIRQARLKRFAASE